jgi:hypothetical protein
MKIDKSVDATAGVKTQVGPGVGRVDPRKERAAILDLFRRNGDPNYGPVFDWHYSDSATPSRSWCLRANDSGELSGFVSVFERHLQIGDARFRAAVAANLIIAESSRSLGAALALIGATQSGITDGDYDVLLARGNKNSSRLIDRLGYKHLGTFQPHHCFFRSRARLQREFGLPGLAASPMINAWSALGRMRQRPLKGFDLVELNADQVRDLDLSCWHRRSRNTVEYTTAELVWRYLDDPVVTTSIYALRSGDDGYVALVAIAESHPREPTIRDVYLDHNVLSIGEVIRLVIDQLPFDSLTVPVLDHCRLAGELTSMGFMHRKSAGLPVMGFWRTDNPIAETLNVSKHWCLWPGFNDV